MGKEGIRIMDRSIKNYEEPLAKPMSTKQLFNFLKHKNTVRKENKQIKKHNKNVGNQNEVGHNHNRSEEHTSELQSH